MSLIENLPQGIQILQQLGSHVELCQINPSHIRNLTMCFLGVCCFGGTICEKVTCNFMHKYCGGGRAVSFCHAVISKCVICCVFNQS